MLWQRKVITTLSLIRIHNTSYKCCRTTTAKKAGAKKKKAANLWVCVYICRGICLIQCINNTILRDLCIHTYSECSYVPENSTPDNERNEKTNICKNSVHH